jgi:hypothetical protein
MAAIVSISRLLHWSLAIGQPPASAKTMARPQGKSGSCGFATIAHGPFVRQTADLVAAP